MAKKPIIADKNIHIRVTADQLERWKAEAEKAQLTLSDWVKKMLENSSSCTISRR